MDELAKRFAELAEKFGPQVADAAKQAATIEAWSTLAGSLMWLVASIAVGFGARFLWRRSDGSDDPEIAKVIAGVGFIIAGVLLLPGIWAWLDPWTWTTLSHPELWLAKKAFKI